MRRSAWIFFASIFLPSLGLAWLAVHSVRDQQVVLEHQQAIICQNLTDALAKSIQGRMDQVRGDFVQATQQLMNENSSPQILAQNFNRALREAWPMAGIGFAVNLDGEIYSPEPEDGPDARTFRDENDRFLSNRENVEVYSSNSLVTNQNASLQQSVASQFKLKLPIQALQATANLAQHEALPALDMQEKNASARVEEEKDKSRNEDLQSAFAGSTPKTLPQGPKAQTTAPDAAKQVPQAKAALPPPAADETASPARIPTATAAAPAAPLVVEAAAADSTPMPAAPTSAPAGPEGGEQSDSLSIARTEVPASSSGAMRMANNEAELPGQSDMPFAKIQRQVIPQQMLSRDAAPLSNTMPEESDFRRLIGTETSGALARFLENKMRLMVWSHTAAEAPIVFGAQLDPGKLVETLKASLQSPEMQAAYEQAGFGEKTASQFCIALLDDTGHPVAQSIDGFQADWKRPFVATEIGEVLPHWEAALYLVDPRQISHAARTLQLTLGLIILLLVAAIVSGGSLIGADVRRQVRLAQQKTDFVSNVSHELKTPLTSIRMFADLLAEKRVPDEERQATYLRIIAAEASRLTRLINNVLDFARLERGAPPGRQNDCDLVDAVRDVVETCGPHLEAEGISFRCEIEAETLPIRGERDALAQIILNLISNAEKYGGKDVLVRVRRQETSAGALGCVDVLDRGAGIPARQVKTVFEPFQRLDDSLSSGIPGSGLGLTLARRMARGHGGDVTYSARAGGGSCFTLTIPLSQHSSTT
jgi:signal transduction histidine kinase